MSKGGLQPHCIRKGDWKLRVAQAYRGEVYMMESDMAHETAMVGQSELYNLALDPAESYCVASLHPEIVSELSHELDVQIATFPQNVQDNYALMKQTVSKPKTPVGAIPRIPEKPRS